MSDDAVVADHDVLIVGGGGAGLRAAIAIAETAPGLDLAVVSKVYPMRSHTVSAEGGAAAAALGAARFFLLTDVAGVLDKAGELLTDLDPAAIAELRADGTISGGMIPKVETCIEAIERGVEGVVILNGKTPHAVLLELFTQHGAGTLIVP